MLMTSEWLFQGGQVWLKDKDASHCRLCEKEFSISRRKVGPRTSTSCSICLGQRSAPRSSLSSTTVATAGRFSATAAQTTSCLCPPRPNRSECATPATPSCCSGAPPPPRERSPPAPALSAPEPRHRRLPLLLTVQSNHTTQVLLGHEQRSSLCEYSSPYSLFVSSLHQRP